MRRDMDFVRDILLKIDQADASIDSDDLHEALSPQPDEATLDYHLEMLVKQAGFIAGIPVATLGDDGAWLDLKLTWAGHEFLDQVRDPDIWDQTRNAARKVGGFSLDILSELAKGFIRAAAQKYVGIGV